MFNPDMRYYDYYTYGTQDEYGQEQLPTSAGGKILMSIYITSQYTQDNINYDGANYIGLTHSPIDNSYVIKYGEEFLKVLYVNTKGRFNQVFLGRMS